MFSDLGRPCMYSSEYLQNVFGTFSLYLHNDVDMVLFGSFVGEARQVWSSGTGSGPVEMYMLKTT